MIRLNELVSNSMDGLDQRRIRADSMQLIATRSARRLPEAVFRNSVRTKFDPSVQ